MVDKRYVYIICSYHEYGPEQMVATLDRSLLARILFRKFPNYSDCIPALEAALSVEDDFLASEEGRDLSPGWGGIQLHVNLLENAEIE